ncbi:DNA-binding transcriptional regulator, MerR family [Variovorax sp. HW608]|uniref:MerR family DNA-binding protein n=1 Tax=Variovorax sp. HW608 TaxID=1034889 RepID=UPI00081FD58F|nr:MerR family DNA-binding protein [Variovorax sp. HW608]SCK43421.1 DNA-binding transcriptional regulator, MerR family [Variovorax sp. HW608]
MCKTMDKNLSAGDAASLAGVTVKLIQQSESLGLLALDGTRPNSNPGLYTEDDVQRLRFIRRGQAFGFSVRETGDLLRLWQDNERASSDVKRIVLEHIEELCRRIEELEATRRSLERLAACCSGDQRSDCPIIDELSELTGFAKCITRLD